MPKNNSNKGTSGDIGGVKNESERSLPPTKQKPPVPKNVKAPKDSTKS